MQEWKHQRYNICMVRSSASECGLLNELFISSQKHRSEEGEKQIFI